MPKMGELSSETNSSLSNLLALGPEAREPYRAPLSAFVIASEAKQPRGRISRPLGCFVATLLAMTGGPPLVQSIQLLLGVA
jgi:hypothetical protein